MPTVKKVIRIGTIWEIDREQKGERRYPSGLEAIEAT
jgi:hypothetical protein